MNRMLVIGMGEIGKALHSVLSKRYETSCFDELTMQLDSKEPLDCIHICFGHKPNEEKWFKSQVKAYQKRFLKEGGLTIIHSSVAVGISRELDAVNSPVRGMHPDLEGGIRTFTKFFGGERASEAAEIFRRAGVKTYIFDHQETTELGKLSETTFYALMIEYIKDLKRDCDRRGLSFTEVYTQQAREYNAGWEKMGFPEYCMPLLVPIMQPQGGHCTIPNAKLWESPFTKFILEQNEDI